MHPKRAFIGFGCRRGIQERPARTYLRDGNVVESKSLHKGVPVHATPADSSSLFQRKFTAQETLASSLSSENGGLTSPCDLEVLQLCCFRIFQAAASRRGLIQVGFRAASGAAGRNFPTAGLL